MWKMRIKEVFFVQEMLYAAFMTILEDCGLV